MTIWTPERKELAIATLKKWHGTPHRDRLAIVGVGIDCAQLINEVLIDSGIVQRIELGAYDTADGLHNVSHRLARAIELLLHVQRVSTDNPEFGDIAIYKTGTRSGHCAFITGREVFHSLAGVGVTHGQYRLWRHQIEFVYRLTQINFKSTEVGNL